MNLRWLMSLAIAGACGVVPSGHAAEPLRLEEAVARSLAHSPLLDAESAEVRAVQARAERGGLPPPYVVGGDLENVLGTGSLSGLQSAEATLRLGRVIELGDKRAARQAFGAAQVTRQRNLSDITRLNIANRTTLRFLEVLADQQRLELSLERVKASARTHREVANWVAAARNPESDLRAAEIALDLAELERQSAERELASARLTLASSWGALKPDFTAVAGKLPELQAMEPFDALAARLPMTHTQRESQLAAEEISAKRRVAAASARPDIDVSLGVRRFETFNDQGLVMSLSVPLGSKGRAALAIAEADAELAAVLSRREAQVAESHQLLFEKYTELDNARTEHELLRTRMMPKAEQALAFTRRGFESGRFSFVALSQAQRTLFELRERSIEAAVRYHRLHAEIDRITTLYAEATP